MLIFLKKGDAIFISSLNIFNHAVIVLLPRLRIFASFRRKWNYPDFTGANGTFLGHITPCAIFFRDSIMPSIMLFQRPKRVLAVIAVDASR